MCVFIFLKITKIKDYGRMIKYLRNTNMQTKLGKVNCVEHNIQKIVNWVE